MLCLEAVTCSDIPNSQREYNCCLVGRYARMYRKRRPYLTFTILIRNRNPNEIEGHVQKVMQATTALLIFYGAWAAKGGGGAGDPS